MFKQATMDGISWFRGKYPEGSLICHGDEGHTECTVANGAITLSKAHALCAAGDASEAMEQCVADALCLAGFRCAEPTTGPIKPDKHMAAGKKSRTPTDGIIATPDTEKAPTPAVGESAVTQDENNDSKEHPAGACDEPVPDTQDESAGTTLPSPAQSAVTDDGGESSDTDSTKLEAAKAVLFAVNSSVPGPYGPMVGKTMGEVNTLKPSIIRLLVQKGKAGPAICPAEVLEAATIIIAAKE